MADEFPLKPHWVLILGVAMVAGFGGAVATAVTKFNDEAKKDRLRISGVQTLATVTDSAPSRRKGPDKIRLQYITEGGSYQGDWIIGTYHGPTMRIWVDPKHPDQFVAENGSTDDSLGFFNFWIILPGGALIGASSAVALFKHWRVFHPRANRRRRNSRRR